MIPRQKDLILAIGPDRHLSSAEIVHAICLAKNFGRFRRRIFCNQFWIVLLIWRLKVRGKLERHYERNESGKIIQTAKVSYCLTSKGRLSHLEIKVIISENSRWVNGQ